MHGRRTISSSFASRQSLYASSPLLALCSTRKLINNFHTLKCNLWKYCYFACMICLHPQTYSFIYNNLRSIEFRFRGRSNIQYYVEQPRVPEISWVQFALLNFSSNVCVVHKNHRWHCKQVIKDLLLLAVVENGVKEDEWALSPL